MPSNVRLTRSEENPRIVKVPPLAPYASLFWKLTPGTALIVSRIVWPGLWRPIYSWVRTALALVESGAWTPPTSLARVPVTTIFSLSNSWVPVDWAKAAVGKATAVEQRRMNFFTEITPHG